MPPPGGRERASARLRGFSDPAASNALGANAALAAAFTIENADLLQVRHPYPLGFSVGVADIVPDHRSLAADRTYPCHGLPPWMFLEPFVSPRPQVRGKSGAGKTSEPAIYFIAFLVRCPIQVQHPLAVSANPTRPPWIRVSGDPPAHAGGALTRR